MRFYTALALSYRAWYARMTPVGWAHQGPAVGLSALQTLNIFSLLMFSLGLFPSLEMHPLVFGSIPAIGFFVLTHLNEKLYCRHPCTPVYAHLKDPVPAVREFPLVYAYLLLSAALFLGGFYAAVRSAA